MNLVLYCEKLTPFLKEDMDKVWWTLSMLVDQTIGEASAIALIAGFDISAQPKDESPMPLAKLPDLVQSMGLSLWRDGSDYLENSYLAYEMEPVKDPEADWRLECLYGKQPPAGHDQRILDCLYGIRWTSTIGTESWRDFCVTRSMALRERNEAKPFWTSVMTCGIPFCGRQERSRRTFLGGAAGLYYGYLDFIAWELPAVLDAARDFFVGSDVAQGAFHVFRRDMGAVRLWDRETEPEVDPETGSLLSRGHRNAGIL